MIFFKKEYNYSIIDDSIDDNFLREWLKENDISLQITDNSTRWCAFAQYYARKQGINDVHATSFAYIISLFFTDMGISASTDMFIKEEQLEYDIVDWINEKMQDMYEPDKAKILFRHIFEIYLEDIFKYEYKTERLNIRLTLSQLERFKSIKAENNNERFEHLLNLL